MKRAILAAALAFAPGQVLADNNNDTNTAPKPEIVQVVNTCQNLRPVRGRRPLCYIFQLHNKDKTKGFKFTATSASGARLHLITTLTRAEIRSKGIEQQEIVNDPKHAFAFRG